MINFHHLEIKLLMSSVDNDIGVNMTAFFFSWEPSLQKHLIVSALSYSQATTDHFSERQKNSPRCQSKFRLERFTLTRTTNDYSALKKCQTWAEAKDHCPKRLKNSERCQSKFHLDRFTITRIMNDYWALKKCQTRTEAKVWSSQAIRKHSRWSVQSDICRVFVERKSSK